jgi:hypothetical protein
MSTIWTLFRATAVVAGSSAALLMGGLMGTAHADPAAPVIPAPNIGEQLLTSAAGAPQVLQNLATAIGGQPPAPPPLAAIRVPQPSTAGLPGATSAVPGASSLVPGLPGATPAATTATPGLGIPGLTSTLPAPAAPASPVAGLPGLTPTVPAAAPTTGSTGLLPQAQLNLPQMPFLGVPLPQQISLPRDLTSLMTGGVPASTPVASPVSAPVTTPNPLLFPVSGLP